MGQNTSNSVWKPCEDLQKTFDLCHCQQRVYNKVLRWNFVIDQILIFHHNLQINSLKILQCDFLDFFFSYFVSHSWGIPTMKITGLSHLFKWENLHNWWLTKYFFAPLYVYFQSFFIIGAHQYFKILKNINFYLQAYIYISAVKWLIASKIKVFVYIIYMFIRYIYYVYIKTHVHAYI